MERFDGGRLRAVRPHARGLRIAGAGTVAAQQRPCIRGDAGLNNPEQLLLVAASSCQLLSFLAIMARARLNVVAYTDEASAVMPEDSEPMRITRITLRPRIVRRRRR